MNCHYIYCRLSLCLLCGRFVVDLVNVINSKYYTELFDVYTENKHQTVLITNILWN